jgi:hypothetical protein
VQDVKCQKDDGIILDSILEQGVVNMVLKLLVKEK